MVAIPTLEEEYAKRPNRERENLVGERTRIVAMIRLPAKPANEDALEQLSVEPIRLRPPMLARHSYARRMDDVRFDAVHPQPPSQPEAITAGLARVRSV